MGEQLQKSETDVPSDLIQLADWINSNSSLVRSFFNQVDYKFIDIDKWLSILKQKIEKLSGKISRHIVSLVASFAGIAAVLVTETTKPTN